MELKGVKPRLQDDTCESRNPTTHTGISTNKCQVYTLCVLKTSLRDVLGVLGSSDLI